MSVKTKIPEVRCRRCLLLFGCFVSLLNVAVFAQTSPKETEEKYFEIRDNFIRQFEKASVPIDVLDEKDKHALAELDKQLKPIIGPVNVEGFPKEGKINLLTLQKDYGFGQVDGLRFSAKQEELFVTTDNILKKYLAGQRELPKTWLNFLRLVSFMFAPLRRKRLLRTLEIPVKSANGKSYVHAFLGLTAQDIGPFIPKDIFVFVTNGNRILAVQSPAATEITEIPQCRNEWEKFAKKKADAMEVYRSSGLNNEKAFDEAVHQYEQQGFEAYQRCYDREAKNQKFFDSLKKQAQSIVDRLLPN